jgi:AcrR family transcriptional regulator
MATGYPKKASDVGRSAAQSAIDAAAEQLNAKLAEKADKVVRTTTKKVDKAAAKASQKFGHAGHAGHHAIVSHAHDHFGADPLEVWTRHGGDTRRPRFTRDDIAAAAIRIADAEGLEAVSMRRLAAELEAGTMTLYHYISTKDELLTLVFDGMMKEMVLPADMVMPADWRVALTTIAHRSRDAMRRHPWVLDITDDPPLGPNSVLHFDQSLQALRGLDIPLTEKIDLLTAVDEYVFGFCLHERNNYSDAGDDLTPRMETYLRALLATGDYPALAELTEHQPLREVWREVSSAMRADGRFDRNLTRILDGFEQSF